MRNRQTLPLVAIGVITFLTNGQKKITQSGLVAKGNITEGDRISYFIKLAYTIVSCW
jgi:hypothetical protein